MWVCSECGTLHEDRYSGVCVEGPDGCDGTLLSLEEAVEKQLTLFELSGNERAQHVLTQLKRQYEASRLAVGKARAKVVTAIEDADAALALLLDFYNLATDRDKDVKQDGALDGVLAEVAEQVNAGALDGDGVTVTAEVLANDRVPFEPDADEIEQVDEDAGEPSGFQMTPAHEQVKSEVLIYPAEAEVFVALAKRAGGEAVALASEKRVVAVDKGDALEVQVSDVGLGVALATARTIFAAAGIEDWRDAGQGSFRGVFPAPAE